MTDQQTRTPPESSKSTHCTKTAKPFPAESNRFAQNEMQQMPSEDLLQNCAKEDLNHTALVQSFIYLLVLDYEAKFVIACSENCSELLGKETNQILGKNPVDLLGQEFLTYFQKSKHAPNTATTPAINNLSSIETPVHLSISQDKTFWLVEIEPVLNSTLNASERTQVMNRHLRRVIAGSITSVVEEYASRFSEIGQFDRVLVYQFLDDWTGKVICEVTNTFETSFLGLHFPASDLPQNARSLFEKYPSRLINDVLAPQQRLITIDGINAEEINLANVRGRSCSEVHLAYLKNMNVRSSYSCSIICRNKLWGLITCHKKSPMNIDLLSRLDCEKIAKSLSMEIMRIQAESKLQMIENFKSEATSLIDKIPDHISSEASFLASSAQLTMLMEADGIAVVNSSGIRCSGSTPPKEQLENIIELISVQSEQRIYYTNCIAQIYPSAREFSSEASGLFAASTGILSNRSASDVLFIWFRKDYTETISWAGMPNKESGPVFKLKSGLNVLSPRVSFEIWKQERRNTCKPWNNEHVFKASLWIHSYAKKNHLGFYFEYDLFNSY